MTPANFARLSRLPLRDPLERITEDAADYANAQTEPPCTVLSDPFLAWLESVRPNWVRESQDFIADAREAELLKERA